MNLNKALWEKGDFTRIAESMRESGEALVKSFGIHKRLKVLDLGCGDGTTALPAARLGADMLGVDIARNLVDAGNKRAEEEKPHELQVSGRRCDQFARARGSFFWSRRIHVWGHVRTKAVWRREGDGASRPTRRSDHYGQLDSKRSDVGGANFEDQLRLHTATAGRLRQPDDMGDREQRNRTICRRASSRREDFLRPGHVYVQLSQPPAALVDAFRKYYGPTMNAFESAEKNGWAADLQKELEDLFNRQNQSSRKDATSIPATFLRVTVALWKGRGRERKKPWRAACSSYKLANEDEKREIIQSITSNLEINGKTISCKLNYPFQIITVREHASYGSRIVQPIERFPHG
jgi:SAM-dependent methyltransferase